MFNRTVVTFLSASSFHQLSDLLPSFGLLHWLESTLWLLVRELWISRGMQNTGSMFCLIHVYSVLLSASFVFHVFPTACIYFSLMNQLII